MLKVVHLLHVVVVVVLALVVREEGRGGAGGGVGNSSTRQTRFPWAVLKYEGCGIDLFVCFQGRLTGIPILSQAWFPTFIIPTLKIKV